MSGMMTRGSETFRSVASPRWREGDWTAPGPRGSGVAYAFCARAPLGGPPLALRRDTRPRRPGDYEVRLGPARLDLDDMEDLRRLLADRTNGTVVLHVGDDSIADTVDDLQDATDRDLQDVWFTTEEPQVMVWLTPTMARAWTRAESPESQSLVDDVARLVAARLTALGPSAGSTLLSFVAILLLAAFALVSFARASDTSVAGARRCFHGDRAADSRGRYRDASLRAASEWRQDRS